MQENRERTYQVYVDYIQKGTVKARSSEAAKLLAAKVYNAFPVEIMVVLLAETEYGQ